MATDAQATSQHGTTHKPLSKFLDYSRPLAPVTFGGSNGNEITNRAEIIHDLSYGFGRIPITALDDKALLWRREYVFIDMRRHFTETVYIRIGWVLREPKDSDVDNLASNIANLFQLELESAIMLLIPSWLEDQIQIEGGLGSTLSTSNYPTLPLLQKDIFVNATSQSIAAMTGMVCLSPHLKAHS